MNETPLRGGPTALLLSLPSGLVVPRTAAELALDLEERGFRLGLGPDQQFTVEATGVSGPLTSADQRAVHRWRHHLTAIVATAVKVCA